MENTLQLTFRLHSDLHFSRKRYYLYRNYLNSCSTYINIIYQQYYHIFYLDVIILKFYKCYVINMH